MNKLFALTLVVMLTFVMGCSGATTKVQRSRVAIADDASQNAVALVVKDADGDTVPYCSGTWVSKSVILTAAHCATAARDAYVRLNNVPDETIVPVVGHKVAYIVKDEENGMYQSPIATHDAVISAIDPRVELALVTVTGLAPMHTTARFASDAPPPGSEVHVVGHVVGLYWSYVNGYVSAIRKPKWLWERKMPFDVNTKLIQVSAPIFKGQSGSAAYDENGEVIGIVSFVNNDGPNIAYLIHVDEVKTFLARSL